MNKISPHGQTELNTRDLQLRFSPAVQEAFRSIARLAQPSKHFDGDIFSVVESWGRGEPTTVHDFTIAMAPIAGEVSRHIVATGDDSMKEAWDDLSVQLADNGFMVSQSRQRKR